MPATGAVERGEVLFEDGVEVALEDAEKDILGQALRAVVVVQRAIEARHAVAGRDDAAEIVRDDDEGEAEALLEVVEQADEPFLAGLVDAGGGLIEEQEPGFGDQGAGDEDALLLAAGQAPDGLLREGQHIDGLEGCADGGAVGFAEGAEEGFASDQAELDDLADGDGERPVDGMALRDVADEGAVGAGLVGGAAEDFDGAGIGLQDAQHELQQCGLAAPVGADDAQRRTGLHVEGDARKSGAAVVGEGDVMDADDILTLVETQVGAGIHVGMRQENGRSVGHAARLLQGLLQMCEVLTH